MAIIARASVTWQHSDADRGVFVPDHGAAFDIAGVPIARDAALVERASIEGLPASLTYQLHRTEVIAVARSIDRGNQRSAALAPIEPLPVWWTPS